MNYYTKTEKISDIEILFLAEEPPNSITDANILISEQFHDLFKNSKISNIPYYISYIHEQNNISELLEKIEPKLIICNDECSFRKLCEILNLDLFYYDHIHKLITSKYKILCLEKITEENKNKTKKFLNMLYSVLVKSTEENPDRINKCYSLKIPSKFYTKDYVLIDIQNIRKTKEVLFIFRNALGEKEFHLTSSYDNYFYTKDEWESDAPLICPVELTKLRKTTKNLNEFTAKYEQDLSMELKHSVDYSYNRKEDERIYNLDVLYWDIEIYNEKSKSFPKPKYANKPINAISFKKKNSPVYVYILDQAFIDKTNIVEHTFNHLEFKIVYKFFNTEVELIKAFAKYVRESNVDLMSGWNTSTFDQPYIFNRMNRLGMNPDIFSPLNLSYIEVGKEEYNIYGLYMADQMVLFKKYVANQRTSYKLSAIAQEEIGQDKVAYEGTLDELYETNIIKFIEYSATDTHLLEELEEKVGFIKLRFELLKICSSTWKRAESTNGLLDPLLIKYAKNNNMVCRNKIFSGKSELDGAYVLKPRTGLYKWVVDFDFRSLYPSIIRTFNIGPDTLVGKINPEDAKNYLYNRNGLKDNIKIIFDPMKRSSVWGSIEKSNLIKLIEENNYIITITGCIFISHSKKVSFFSDIVAYLMDSRDKYKTDMKKEKNKINDLIDPKEIENQKNIVKKLDAIQQAYKILNNAIYGSLAQEFFRFFNINLAESITLSGQEVLKFSITHLCKYLKNGKIDIDNNFLDKFEDVDHAYNIYADTDSIFINMGDYLIDNKKV